MNGKLSHLVKQVKTSDIGRRMASGAFWSFTGNAIAKVIVLASGILCAHILSQKEYGELGIVRSTISMFVIFGTAGLGLTATKYISEYKQTNKARVYSIYCLTNGFALIAGIITACLFFFLSDTIAKNTLHEPHLAESIRIGALLLFVTILNGAQNGVLLGFEDFKSRAYNTLLGSIAEAALMLVGAYYGGVFGAVLGFGSGYVVLYFCNLFSIKQNFRKHDINYSSIRIERQDFRLLYKFSLPAALSTMLVGPTYWLIKTVLVRNSGFAELAIYEAADHWKTLILFIPGAISQIILPILSSLSSTDKNRYWKVLKANLAINVSIATILAIFVAVLSPYLMRFYGNAYGNGYLILIILALSTITNTASAVVGLSISSRGKMWVGLLFNAIWAIMLLLLSALFTYLGYGALGISYSILISYFIHTIYQFIYLRVVIRNN